MTPIASLIKEFERETQTTRKHFERLPNDKLDWRPHEKSFTAGALASHIVECIDWTGSIFKLDQLDVDTASYKPYLAKSSGDLLSTFDDTVTRGKQVLANVADEKLEQPWGLKINGRLRFEKPRAEVFRDFTLSHLIHHRGQFSVYLRLLGVPVPGSYGPSADELPSVST
jgi:uncharacterized damage-inducible protein DinB